MKNKAFGIWIWVCSILLLGGCLSTKGIKKTFESGPSENEMYAQVPDQNRKPVEKAKANQLAAAEQLKFAQERLELAKLQKELATKKEKLSDLELELAEMAHKEAILGVELAQWEAIDTSGLGEKEKNIKTIYGLRSKQAKIETSRLRVQEDHDTLVLRIERLAEQIKVQKETVKTMQSVLEGSDASAPAAPAAPAGSD